MKKFYLFFAALFAFVLSANADTKTLFSQDFSTATTVSETGFKSPSLGEGAFKLDGNQFMKFITFSQGANNDRSAYLYWGQDVIKAEKTDNYQVSFWFRAQKWGNNHQTTEFTVSSAEKESVLSKNAANSNYRSKNPNWLFDLTQLSYGKDGDGGGKQTSDATQIFAVNGDSVSTVQLETGKWYVITLTVNTAERSVDYDIYDGTADSHVTNSYTVPDTVQMWASGIHYNAGRYQNVCDFGNISVSREIEGEVANDPTVVLSTINNQQRVYTINYVDGETLHITFNGEEVDPVSTGLDEATGKMQAVWSNNPNYDASNEGLVTDDCNEGELVVWTEKGEAVSNKVSFDVTNNIIPLPAVTTSIVNVEDGYGKTYKVVADNSNVELKPVITIDYTFTPSESGEKVSGTINSGETVSVPSKGSIQFTTQSFGFGETNSTVENNIAYHQSAEYNFAHWTADDITKAGFAANGNVADDSKFTNYGRYFGYHNGDSAKIVYNKIPQFTKKSSEWKDSVIVGHVTFTATPKVNMNIYQGIGLVSDGRKGDDGSGDWIKNSFIKVNDVKDDDIIMFSQTGNYGSTSLHPFVETLDAYLAADNAPVTDVFTGKALKEGNGWGLYRVSNALHKITVMSAAGSTTGINNVNVTESEKANANAPIYTIGGVQVSGKNLPAGVYIQNGKKFVVK